MNAASMGLTANASERAVVGGILRSGCDLPEGCTSDAFADLKCRAIMTGVEDLRRRLVASDPVALLDHFEAKGTAEMLTPEIAMLMGDSLGAAEVEAHWPRVRDAWAKRLLSERVREVLSRAADMTPEELVGAVYSAASSVNAGVRDGAQDLVEVLRGVAAQIMAAAEGAAQPGIPTGYSELDALMGGLSEGNVTILAARPSEGKSALAKSILLNAQAAGYPGHWISLEDTSLTVGKRVFADRGYIDLQGLMSVRPGSLTKGDLDGIGRAFREVQSAQARIIVDDSPGLSSAQIAARVKRHRERNGTRLVVVDYIGLMREDVGRGGSKGAEVAKAMAGLVHLARTERVAVLAVCQLNRKAEEREEGEPRMSDLRDTGELEQAAYAVMLVHRPERHGNTEDWWKGKGKVMVVKNKNGPTGDAVLGWDGPSVTYRSIVRSQ